jgi:glycosyltransferase involved in cell wall biosynthesis
LVVEVRQCNGSTFNLRILFTTFTFAPEGNGVAEVVTAQATGLAKRGYDVSVATAFNGKRSPTDAPGVTVSEFDVAYMSNRVVMAPEEISKYQRFISQFSGEVIVTHCWGAWSTDNALPVLRTHSAKKVFVSHGYEAHRWHPYPRFPWGIPSWIRGLRYVFTSTKALSIFDQIVFLSSRVDWGRYFDRRLVQWLGRPPSTTIPNGSYPQPSREGGKLFRKELGIEGLLVLHVGGYYDRKNQPLALRAFLRANLDRATLVFIGNEMNDYANGVSELNRRINPAPQRLRVLFLEKQPRERIRAAYSAADLFVLSSTEETQPLVVLDAMAAGTAFVATDVGSVSELPGGVIVKGEREMAQAIARLARDTERRSELGNAGLRAVAATYNWSKVLDEYERVFSRLTAKTKREERCTTQ